MSASIEKVQGLMYQTTAGTYRNPDKEICTWIFIPSHSLNISEREYVEKANGHYMTLAAFKADRLVMEQISQINKGPHPLSQEQKREMIDRAKEEANKSALTPVELSKNAIDEVKALHEESIDPNTPKDRVAILKAKIAQIIRDSDFFPKAQIFAILNTQK